MSREANNLQRHVKDCLVARREMCGLPWAHKRGLNPIPMAQGTQDTRSRRSEKGYLMGLFRKKSKHDMTVLDTLEILREYSNPKRRIGGLKVLSVRELRQLVTYQRDGLAKLQAIVDKLLEVGDDLRCYTHDWDWKYGECWDKELNEAREAAEAAKEG